MSEAADNKDRIAAAVPAFRPYEFATAHTEYTASKGMSRVTMWVSRERGEEFRAAAMKLRTEQRDTQGYVSATNNVPMMKYRDLQALLFRAMAAIESPRDLSKSDVGMLLEDLEAATTNLDCDGRLPERDAAVTNAPATDVGPSMRP